MAEIVKMPKLGFDMAEGMLVRWVILEGQPISKGMVLAEIETDKATVEVESAFDGIVARHLVPQGEVVPVNTPIAMIAAPGESIDSVPAAPATPGAPATSTAASITGTPPAAPPPPAGRSPSTAPGRPIASPLARRLAGEMKIDLQKVSGSGPGGRVTRKDILAHAAAPAIAQAAAPAVTPPAAPQPPAAASQAIPVNRLRAAIGRRMVESKQQAPHFYITHEYDMEAVLNLRKRLNTLLPEEEKLSVNDFIVKAVALTLREFPNLNAALQGEQIVQHGQVNVGVAVAIDGGLLTVVNRDTDRKTLRQIGDEMRSAIQRAREGKVRPEDIEGSTFSISNLGMYDVEHFIAIINPPEAAILAVGSARQVPVVKEGQVVPGWRMKATLSADHRVTDGAEAAQFLQALAKYLEDPLRLLM